MKQSSIQRIRQSKGLSQSQLSKLSGVNLRTLQDFEQERKPIKNAKGEMLYRLSLVLDCSVNELIDDSSIIIDINSRSSSSHIERYYENIQSKALYDTYYTFPVTVPKCKVDMKRIYPTKQALIYKLHNILCSDKRIIAAMLFGSSITMRCNKDSDIDLAIRLDDRFIDRSTKNDISEIVQEVSGFSADIIWYDRIDKLDRIYHDICKGVQII